MSITRGVLSLPEMGLPLYPCYTQLLAGSSLWEAWPWCKCCDRLQQQVVGALVQWLEAIVRSPQGSFSWPLPTMGYQVSRQPELPIMSWVFSDPATRWGKHICYIRNCDWASLASTRKLHMADPTLSPSTAPVLPLNHIRPLPHGRFPMTSWWKRQTGLFYIWTALRRWAKIQLLHNSHSQEWPQKIVVRKTSSLCPLLSNILGYHFK